MFEKIHGLNDRKFRSLTGLKKKDFLELTVVFSACCQAQDEEYRAAFLKATGRQLNGGGSPIFKTPTEKLFFVLYYLKTYPTFENLGFIFGCSNKTAHENLYKFLPILERALKQLKVLPKRSFETVDEFIGYIKDNKDLLIDATERIHHRKSNYEAQKELYNGKKKTHTVKNTIISNTSQNVLYVGETVLGAKHDFKMLKDEFPSHINWFEDFCVWIDLGYIGFVKEFICGTVKIPYKKPYKTKKNPNPQFTPEQKEYNKSVSKTRVLVENAICGIKRYYILNYRFRNKSELLRDKAIFLAAGLWNLSKSFFTE